MKRVPHRTNFVGPINRGTMEGGVRFDQRDIYFYGQPINGGFDIITLRPDRYYNSMADTAGKSYVEIQS